MRRQTHTRMQVESVVFMFLFLILAATSFALSVTIHSPVENEKIEISVPGVGIPVLGTVNVPAHPEKESEARITWSLYFGGRYYTVTTKSGETDFLQITKFPTSNSVWGFKTISAGANSQQFYGTGDFYGQGALDVMVLEGGDNYEGYIVNNSEPYEQDMVIGQNTSTLPGCPHLIKGFCVDAHEDIPSDKRAMGVPWTSSSSSHWAYWVRQAVVYGNQNSKSADDILDAVWYITDRSGVENDITQNIAYPANGPTKNTARYYFWTDPEGWSFVSVSPFTSPISSNPSGRLELKAQNNTNTFGYWKSPDNGALPMLQGSTYKATFNVQTDVTDSSHVPQIRLRINAMNAQQGDTYTISSTGSGNCSPDTSGIFYSVIYTPSSSVWDQNAVISFDLLNFDPSDAAAGAVRLDDVAILRYEEGDLLFLGDVKTYEFNTSAEGWQFSGAVTPFSAPQSNTAFSGTLDLTAVNNTNTFGFWQNNTSDITIQASNLYKVEFIVHCDQSDSNKAPVLRLRAFTANNQITQSVERIAAPIPLYGDYTLYFQPPSCATGQGLGLAFDIMNFTPTAATSPTLSLDRVHVSSYFSLF